MRRRVMAVGLMLSFFVFACMAALGQGAARDEKSSEAEIRQALADWVSAVNRKDYKSSKKIWGPKVVGWFPEAAEFGESAAFQVGGVQEKRDATYSTYELKIDDVEVAGTLAAVYDIWTETLHFNDSPVTVRRIIRGSELWRVQPDGKWRIVRWVSAPEKWEKVK